MREGGGGRVGGRVGAVGYRRRGIVWGEQRGANEAVRCSTLLPVRRECGGVFGWGEQRGAQRPCGGVCFPGGEGRCAPRCSHAPALARRVDPPSHPCRECCGMVNTTNGSLRSPFVVFTPPIRRTSWQSSGRGSSVWRFGSGRRSQRGGWSGAGWTWRRAVGVGTFVWGWDRLVEEAGVDLGVVSVVFGGGGFLLGLLGGGGRGI